MGRKISSTPQSSMRYSICTLNKHSLVISLSQNRVMLFTFFQVIVIRNQKPIQAEGNFTTASTGHDTSVMCEFHQEPEQGQ